jgi:hypothetical protein
MARPSTRFGGQTCKDKPYSDHMRTALGLLFEKNMTIS